jgi:D-alanyl-D-alanine carboxypeptidase (penicillin-binding protein 5/6)
MKLGRGNPSLARIVILAALAVAAVVPQGAAEIVSRAALVVDAEDGRTLFAKNPDQRMHPASTTKVMTAILAIESGRLDELVTIRSSDARVEPSVLGLFPGERITLRDLVYGLLLRSGNDAARAIARHLGGTQEQFAALMNARARDLGCSATHFTNPHGLTHAHHYTTARDLGRIMRHAMHNPEFRKITGTRHYRSRSSHAVRDFYNKNKLLRRYAGATGGKPGYTRAAQQTLVASAARSGHELVVVCLASRGRALWSDASSLLDLGFRRVAVAGAGGGIAPTATMSSR